MKLLLWQSKLKVTKEKQSKKKAKSRQMTKCLNNLKDKLEEMKSECGRWSEENKLVIEEEKLEEMKSEYASAREAYKLAIEKKLQLESEYVLLFTFLFGGDGGI